MVPILVHCKPRNNTHRQFEDQMHFLGEKYSGLTGAVGYFFLFQWVFHMNQMKTGYAFQAGGLFHVFNTNFPL